MILLLTCVLGAVFAADLRDASHDQEILKGKATTLRAIATGLGSPTDSLRLKSLLNIKSASMQMLNSSVVARGEDDLEAGFREVTDTAAELEREILTQFGPRLNALCFNLFQLATVVDSEADEIHDRLQLSMRVHS